MCLIFKNNEAAAKSSAFDKKKERKRKTNYTHQLFSSHACRLKFCNILLPNFAPHIELQLARKFCHEPTTSFTAAHSELKFPGMGDRC